MHTTHHLCRLRDTDWRVISRFFMLTAEQSKPLRWSFSSAFFKVHCGSPICMFYKLNGNATQFVCHIVWKLHYSHLHDSHHLTQHTITWERLTWLGFQKWQPHERTARTIIVWFFFGSNVLSVDPTWPTSKVIKVDITRNIKVCVSLKQKGRTYFSSKLSFLTVLLESSP